MYAGDRRFYAKSSDIEVVNDLIFNVTQSAMVA